MSGIMLRAAAIAVLLALGLGLFLGYRWGGSNLGEQKERVTSLKLQLADAIGERDSATETASLNADNVQVLRIRLQDEARRRIAQQQLAERELAARGNRIAELERDAAHRESDIRHKAATDEDCAALRDLPVCAAVADRLWGEAAAADTH